MRWVIAAAVVGALGTGTGIAGAPAGPGPAVTATPGVPQAVQEQGVIVGVDLRAQTVTVRLDRGLLASYRAVEGTRVEFPGGLGALRPGMRVQIYAVLIAGDIPLALRILVEAPRPPAVTDPGVLVGVVLDAAGPTLTLLRATDTLLTVLITGTTVVEPAPPVPRMAVVAIRGTMNADGSLSARTITIRFDPRQAARAQGQISHTWPGAGMLLADGTIVTWGEGTWILRGHALLPAERLAVGTMVMVWGEGQAPVVGARVIEVKP